MLKNPRAFFPKDAAAQPEETEEDRADIAGLKRTKKAQRSIAAMNLKAKPKTPGDWIQMTARDSVTLSSRGAQALHN